MNKTILGFVVGAALFCGLFLWRGIDTVGGLLSEAGIALALVCLFSPPEQLLAAEAWRRLFPPGSRPRYVRVLLASWMGSAVNTLLPVATIGGELAKARILILWFHPGAETMAAMIVDKTIQAIAVVVWGLVGMGFLVFFIGDTGTVVGVLIGAGFLVLGIAGFIFVQIRGGFSIIADKLTAWAKDGKGEAILQDVETMEISIREIYRDVGRLAAATALRLFQRVFLAGEVVLIGYLLGAPIGIVEAVILKGVIGAIRGFSFAIPGALGVQEGGYVAIGAILGYPPDLMIALSLATRIREILPSIPFLLYWQVTEGRTIWSRHKKNSAPKMDAE